MTERSFRYALLFVFSEFCRGRAAIWKEVPSFNVKDLTWEKFDAEYLDKKPVILEGVTSCPKKFGLDNILKVCHPDVEVEVFKQTENTGKAPLEWNGKAGLTEGVRKKLKAYVKDLKEGKTKGPTYAFAIPLVDHCLKALEQMEQPAHFIGTFSAHWTDSYAKCLNNKALPGVQAYLNSNYFATNMHIDSWNTAFYSSMCEGEKRWRIVSNDDLLREKKEWAPYLSEEGTEMEDQNGHKHLVFADLVGNFETWSKDSPLEKLNVTVYETVLKPGSILYLPSGVPHAAKATTPETVMISTNEHSYQDLYLFHTLCTKMGSKTAAENDSNCKGYKERGARNPETGEMINYQFDMWSANKRAHGKKVVRKNAPFYKTYGCGDKKNFCELSNPSEEDKGMFEYCKDVIDSFEL